MIFKNKVLGAALLIAGTSIGAGMLALPITTGGSGIFLATCLFIICFFYMLLSAFILLEACGYEKGIHINIISMAGKRLGAIGQVVAWLCFILLMYAAAAAYMSGGASLVKDVLAKIPYFPLQWHLNIIIFAVIFSSMVYLGARSVDLFNQVFMYALLLVYASMTVFMLPHIHLKYFTNIHADGSLAAAVPIIVLAFTAQVILPSVRAYLNNDAKKVKIALWVGSIVPLIFYLIWEIVIVGIIPQHGSFGLLALRNSHHPVSALTTILHSNLGLVYIGIMVGIFSFLALVTSFLGVGLSLVDFLLDGLKLKRNYFTRFFIILLAMVPPLLFAIYFPSGFILALSYAGVFVAILYGILPALMVWRARYFQHLTADFKVFGGRVVLVLMILCSLIVVGLQVATTLNWIN